MTEFERLTKAPDVLGGFLRSLPCLDGPWDKEFHKRFCERCAAENCDVCPNEQYRNNPVWWLSLEGEPVEQPGTAVIDLDPEKADFNDERLFALMPDDQEKTAILAPLKSGATSIKLTKQTAEVLVAMLNHQIREWSKS